MLKTFNICDFLQCVQDDLTTLLQLNGDKCGCCGTFQGGQKPGEVGNCPMASSSMSSLPEPNFAALTKHPRFLKLEPESECENSCLVIPNEGGRSGAKGVMFYVKALSKPITVTSFDTYFFKANTSGRVQVYTRRGRYTGYEGKEDAWRIVYDAKTKFKGRNKIVQLGALDNGGVTINPGDIQSFFFWSEKSVIMYDKGESEESEGEVFANDDYLEVYEGLGTSKKFSDLLYAPRTYKGIIRYVSTFFNFHSKEVQTFICIMRILFLLFS